jgi:hypothetical protein
MTNAAVLLYTMRCNIDCAHCSVDSHPRRNEKMELKAAVKLVAGLAGQPEIDFIDISGGEPMLFRKELLSLARVAKAAAKSLRIVTNGFWAKSAERATAILAELQSAGVSSVGLSIDVWHLDYLTPSLVRHYLDGCRAVGMQPLLSGVLSSSTISYSDPFPTQLEALLNLYGLSREECTDVYTWAQQRARLDVLERAEFDRASAQQLVLVAWQPLTGEGRAIHLEVATKPFHRSTPERCDAAGELPTIDEAGRLFPCCAPWISRKEHSVTQVVDGAVGPALKVLREDPLIKVIHDRGPQVLIEHMRARGVNFPDEHSGICNQCGMLLDRVKMSDLRQAALQILSEI